MLFIGTSYVYQPPTVCCYLNVWETVNIYKKFINSTFEVGITYFLMFHTQTTKYIFVQIEFFFYFISQYVNCSDFN